LANRTAEQTSAVLDAAMEQNRLVEKMVLERVGTTNHVGKDSLTPHKSALLPASVTLRN
jgi:hypothetical protein